MSNLNLYDKVRKVPKEAQKTITGGRLNGKTDINPMWRIKTLTENFGPCGIGWYYEITSQWLEQGCNGEVAGFCNINLYVKDGDTWSKPIQGTGGSAFIANEKKGAYTSDEVYKMALTDAISVACKALGVGADIYWSSDKTKYDKRSDDEAAAPAPANTTESALSETEINGILLDIRSATTEAELKVKWNEYKHLNGASNNQILFVINEMGDKLGLKKNGKTKAQ